MKRKASIRCMICAGVALAIFMGPVGPVLADFAEDCFGTAVTQREMNRCAAQDLRLRGAELDMKLKTIRSGLGSESARAFNASQHAWENWIELQCNWERDRAKGGSIAALLYLECLADQTRLRSQRLEQLVCTSENGANPCEQE